MLPAAAAGIAMAAEVSAGVRLEVDALSVNTASDGGVKVMQMAHNNQFYHAPIQFSISGEKAGGTLKLTDKNVQIVDEKAGDAMTGAWDIWFKPVDPVKFEIGAFKIVMNQEEIGWWRSDSKIGGDDGDLGNFKVTLEPIEGLSIDAMLSSAWGSAWFKDKKTVAVEEIGDDLEDDAKNWYEAAKYTGDAAAYDDYYKDNKSDIIDAYLDHYIDTHDTDSAIKELGFMVHYGADFGTVSAMFSGNNNFKNLKFGAGYSGSVDPVSFFVNVLGYTAAKVDKDTGNADPDKTAFDKIRVEAFAKTSVDALAAKIFVPFEFKTNVKKDTKTAGKLDLGAILRLDYTIGDYTLFLETGDSDFIKDDFSMQVKPGVKFNVGECEVEAAVDITAQKDFKFSVPVSFMVKF